MVAQAQPIGSVVHAQHTVPKTRLSRLWIRGIPPWNVADLEPTIPLLLP